MKFGLVGMWLLYGLDHYAMVASWYHSCMDG